MGLFKRGKHDGDELDVDAEVDENVEAGSTYSRRSGGPLDVEEADSSVERIDFGSLLLPVAEGLQIRVELDENEDAFALTMLVEGTELQLQAFAAPRSAGIWEEVRQEIAEGVRASQGRATEAEGPYGREVRAEISSTGPKGEALVQKARFLGADGPRWFLRGLMTGNGAIDPSQAAAAEVMFGQVVVSRGTQAAAPREPLPLSVPETPNLVRDDDSAAP